MAKASKGRVLVVDDEDAVRQSIDIVLSQSGYETALAGSVKEALTAHEQAYCDVMLVDKNLPGESGIDLVRQLRDHGDDVPVIVMTGFGSVESAIVGLNLRVSAYVEKPFDDIFAVPAMVERALREHKQRVGAGAAIKHFRRAHAALQEVAAQHAGRSLRITVCGPAVDREAIVRWLARADDTVEHFPDVAAALAVSSSAKVDLVVLDMASEVDIFGSVELAHAKQRSASCVVVADHPALSDVVRLIGLDTRAILERPLEEKQIRERLGPIAQQLRHKDEG